MKDYFVLYHNNEVRGKPPSRGKRMSFSTSKRIIENAKGSECFMIVGMGEKTKEYYLWSWQIIDQVKDQAGEYIGSGPAMLFRKAILLNDLPGFNDFKTFCGNFGIGFQNINKSQFKNTLAAIVALRKIER
jgi:hypothetical protein